MPGITSGFQSTVKLPLPPSFSVLLMYWEPITSLAPLPVTFRSAPGT
jgi:hypothetical protein